MVQIIPRSHGDALKEGVMQSLWGGGSSAVGREVVDPSCVVTIPHLQVFPVQGSFPKRHNLTSTSVAMLRPPSNDPAWKLL